MKCVLIAVVASLAGAGALALLSRIADIPAPAKTLVRWLTYFVAAGATMAIFGESLSDPNAGREPPGDEYEMLRVMLRSARSYFEHLGCSTSDALLAGLILVVGGLFSVHIADLEA